MRIEIRCVHCSWKSYRRRIKHGYDNVPHYKEAFDKAGVKPEDIKSLEDIRKLPFITKENLAANYPTGLFAVPKEVS